MAALPVLPVLVATTATQSLTTLGALALAAVAPRAANDLGVSAALIGYQVGAVYLGAMISALFGGGLVRRLGPTRTSQLALWLVAGGCVLSASGTVGTLAAGAIVMGWGYGITNPAASHLLARLPTAGSMNLIFSIKQCGVPIGAVIAGLVMPPLTVASGWRSALLACAVAIAAFSVYLQRHRRSWDEDRDASTPLLANPLGSLALMWNNRVLRWLALSSFLYSAVQLSLSGFLVTFLVADIGVDLVHAGTVLAAAHTAGAAGRLAWGWLADRLRSGTITLIANGCLGIVGALATAAIAPDWPIAGIVAVAAIFGFSAIGWNGVFMAVIARQAPRDIGAATGASLFITYAGIVVGPAAFGELHDRGGLSYAACFALLAILTAIGVACLALARRAVTRM
ncbi:MAG TPA: MFS transporter [Burkholderiales bacterium]|nr:MFS transporter [Burkholderiales bacterium]